MPKLTPTLWIFNAITLPVVGLVITLTPKAPTALNDSSSQPVNTPDIKSSKKSDPAKERLQSSTKELVSLPSVQSLAPDIKPSSQKIKAGVAQPTRPTTPVKSPAIAPKQVVAASNTLSSPKKTHYTPLPVSPALISLRPSQRVLPTPFATPDDASFMTPEATVTPSPQTVLPTPPTELPTPTLPFSTEASPTPGREYSSDEVQSLCQKFPRNSRCKNTLTFTTLEALFAPEREYSSQEMQSLCQKFPRNSRCNTNTATPDTSTPTQGNTTPPDSSETQKWEERIVH